MDRYTPDNTAGFSPADLAILNAAHTRLVAEGWAASNLGGEQDKAIDDALANWWVPGLTAEELVRRVRRDPAAVALGRKVRRETQVRAGSSTSEAKRAASRRNGAKRARGTND